MNFKLLLVTFFITANCFAQDKGEPHTANVTKVTFINPGFSYEKSIARFQTLYVQAFMNTSATFSYSSSVGSSSKFYFDPAATLQYRYYYNGAKRLAKEKRTEMNSMNYVTAVFESVFTKRHTRNINYTEKNMRPINSLGLAWGLQRNYLKRFSLDLNVGLGYLFTTETVPSGFATTIKENVGQLTPMGQINIGLWLNRKK